MQVKIGKDSIKEYRYLNDIYQYLEKERINVLDNKKAYLKLLLNGKVKLFEYEYHRTNLNQTNPNYLQKRTIDPFVDYYYYILKDNELILLRNLGYKKRLIDLFSEMNQLVAKINDDEYTLENIYLIVKYYNDAQ